MRFLLFDYPPWSISKNKTRRGDSSSIVLCSSLPLPVASSSGLVEHHFPFQKVFLLAWDSILLFNCDDENDSFHTLKGLCLLDEKDPSLLSWNSLLPWMSILSLFTSSGRRTDAFWEVSNSILSMPYISITPKAPQSLSLISLIFFYYEYDMPLSLTLCAQLRLPPWTLCL